MGPDEPGAPKGPATAQGASGPALSPQPDEPDAGQAPVQPMAEATNPNNVSPVTSATAATPNTIGLLDPEGGTILNSFQVYELPGGYGIPDNVSAQEVREENAQQSLPPVSTPIVMRSSPSAVEELHELLHDKKPPSAKDLQADLEWADSDGVPAQVIEGRGYDYTYNWVIGRTNEGISPEQAMSRLKTDPNGIFPFRVVDLKEGSSIQLGHEYDLQGARFSFDNGKFDKGNYVEVIKVSPTSFSFRTLPGHFDKANGVISFTTFEKDGLIILQQHGTAPNAGGFNAHVAPDFAKSAWRHQAQNLADALHSDDARGCTRRRTSGRKRARPVANRTVGERPGNT